jgi:hypothetical protein
MARRRVEYDAEPQRERRPLGVRLIFLSHGQGYSRSRLCQLAGGYSYLGDLYDACNAADRPALAALLASPLYTNNTPTFMTMVASEGTSALKIKKIWRHSYTRHAERGWWEWLSPSDRTGDVEDAFQHWRRSEARLAEFEQALKAHGAKRPRSNNKDEGDETDRPAKRPRT